MSFETCPLQGNDPYALDVLAGSINGQRMASEEDMPCTTCGEFKATKKCSACKMVSLLFKYSVVIVRVDSRIVHMF